MRRGEGSGSEPFLRRRPAWIARGDRRGQAAGPELRVLPSAFGGHGEEQQSLSPCGGRGCAGRAAPHVIVVRGEMSSRPVQPAIVALPFPETLKASSNGRRWTSAPL